MPENTGEKVLDLQKARVFRTFGPLGNPAITASTHFLNPVEVVGDDGVRLGWASLYWIDHSLSAHIALVYASPERLTLETDEPLYARPLGVEFLAGEPFERRGAIEFGDADATEFHVFGVQLSRHPAFKGQQPAQPLIVDGSL